MTYLKRKIEQELATWATKDNARPLLIQGARRVGKTSIVEHIGKSLFKGNFVKLDFQTDLTRIEAIFDGPTDDVAGIISRIAEYKRARITPKETLLAFDEVQLSEKALNSLRFLSGTPWKVIATGSLLGVTTKKRSLPFPSGVEQIQMHPLDFEEFLWAFNENVMAHDIRAHAASCEPYVLHDRALDYYQRYLVIGGMPKVVTTFVETGSFASVSDAQREIDTTYTADMTDPENGISGVSAKRIWESLPKQLLRSSTKKFKYADVVRGGRRERLLEPLEWLAAAGIVSINDLTCDHTAPLAAFNDEEGSFFKVYGADTGLMFHKFGIEPAAFLDPVLKSMLAADFRGALAENYVMQVLRANGVRTFYWMANEKVGQGEVDFVFQDPLARIVPVEVKSTRNVKAKSLERFVREGRSPYAVLLSENNFSSSVVGGTDCIRKNLPLYAAFCINASLA